MRVELPPLPGPTPRLGGERVPGSQTNEIAAPQGLSGAHCLGFP